MNRYFLFMVSLLLISTTMAQNETEALRYSFYTHGGSARYQAMGGALGGLGSDFSLGRPVAICQRPHASLCQRLFPDRTDGCACFDR